MPAGSFHCGFAFRAGTRVAFCKVWREFDMNYLLLSEAHGTLPRSLQAIINKSADGAMPVASSNEPLIFPYVGVCRYPYRL